MKVKYLMIATVATLLAACSNDDNEVNNGPVEARIKARMGAETRAVNDANSTFEAGDAIGVIVTKVEQLQSSTVATSGMVSRYRNVKYTASQSGSPVSFAAEQGAGIFFQDATETVTFAAYYPYAQSTTADQLPGTDGNGVIPVNTQNNNTKSSSANAQATIDFLFASGATATKSSPTVAFENKSAAGGPNTQFQHKMAQLKLVVKASTNDGFTAEEAKAVCNPNSSYELNGLIHEGTFTLKSENNTVTATAAADVTKNPVNNWGITGCAHADNTEGTQRTYTLILLPQDKSSSALTFKATIGGQKYENSSSISPNLQAGKTYTYTITVKKTGLSIGTCQIDNWQDGGNGSGDAVM